MAPRTPPRFVARTMVTTFSSVVVILADSLREWVAVLGGRKPAVSSVVTFEPSVAVAGD